MTQEKKVLIIGAGLAGLTLANSLHKQGIPFEIYEREESIHSRTQGWSLDLRIALDALKKCVPEESYKTFSQNVCVVPGSEFMSFNFVNVKTGDIYIQFNTDQPGVAYRVHRRKLRQWLLYPIKNHIRWNKKFIKYEEHDNNVRAFFEDGTQATGDILVATDGAQSPVASQLLAGKQKFEQATNISKVRMFGATRTISKDLWDAITKNPHFFSLALSALEDEDEMNAKPISLFCSVQEYDPSKAEVEVLWAVSRYDGEDVLSKLTNEYENGACLDLVKSWVSRGFPEDSLVRKLVVETPKGTKVTPVFIRERVPTPETLQAPGRKVVLVGDAAHPMSMFRGQGGNHALIDASNLGAEIGHYFSGTKTLDEATGSYYEEMIPRAKKAVEESQTAAIAIHTQPAEVILKIYNNLDAAAYSRLEVKASDVNAK